jgi:hypothetical protein
MDQDATVEDQKKRLNRVSEQEGRNKIPSWKDEI